MEFAPLGWMQWIIDNPEKKVLLFLDEIGRAKDEVQAAIFDLMTSKIKGKYYPKLQVVMAMNYGTSYISDFSFEDDAFIRRCLFFKYQPSKKDVRAFFKANNYHQTIIDVIDTSGVNFLDYGLKNEDGYEFEQTTNLGSWYSFNQRLINKAKIDNKELKDLTLPEVVAEFTVCSKLFFNERSSVKIKQALDEMLNVNVDIEKDILAKGTIPKAFESKTEDILLKLKSFIVNEPNKINDSKNKDLYLKNTIKLLEKKGDYIIQIVTELQKVKGENESAAKQLVNSFLTSAPSELIEDLLLLIGQ